MSDRNRKFKDKSKLIAITADHITYIDQQLPSEYDNNRLWYILKNMFPLTEADWETARSLSIYWFNINTLGCEYNAAVERKLLT